MRWNRQDTGLPAANAANDTTLLSVESLSVAVRRDDGAMLPIVSDVSFDLQRGETLGIVGESGSGKSLLSLALIGLLPGSARVDGRIGFQGRDLTQLAERELCAVRGAEIGMIFQEPMSALNPAMRIGDQIAEGLRLRGAGRSEADRKALELLDRVRISDAGNRIAAFPHELSGGQRQRVVIAIALAGSPKLLIADEPTTALDVTVQREILAILAELVAEDKMGLILVSHDLGVIAQSCARTLVMYAGTGFELAPTNALLSRPLNPYTQGLLAAIPRRRTHDADAGTTEPAARAASLVRRRLKTIDGTVPSFSALPPGCRFAPRCPQRIAECQAGEPAFRPVAPGRFVRCLRAQANSDPTIANGADAQTGRSVGTPPGHVASRHDAPGDAS